MVELKYIGQHQPYGMVVDVSKEKAELLLSSGEYEPAYKEKTTKVKKPKKVEKKIEEVKEDDGSSRDNDE